MTAEGRVPRNDGRECDCQTYPGTRATPAAIAYVRAMNEAGPISAATAVPVYAPGPAPAAGGKVGVLLVNLGTPDGADPDSVRRYFKEFLSDTRVVENRASSGSSSSTGSSCRSGRGARRGLPEDLDRARRIAAQDHHPAPGGKARRQLDPRDLHHGRLGDALRQSLDRSAATAMRRTAATASS